jgi:phosphate transport system permease protein
VSAQSTTPAAVAIPRARRSIHVKDTAFRWALLGCLLSGLALLAVLFYDVFAKGWDHVDVDFLTSFSSIFPQRAGVESALMGTIWLMLVCAGFIIPVGVATAIYLEEYADNTRWYNRLVEVNIQNLAAVPSIVYGILGLAFGPVVAAGGLTLGLLVLPVVIIAGREAIRAVPPSIREASLALGATKWQTIWKQVLPAAVPGIATGVILSLSRAIGETAPLIMVGAALYVAANPTGLDSQFTALPLQIFDWISRPQTEFKEGLAAAAILVLLAILLTMNAVAIWLRNRYERKW